MGSSAEERYGLPFSDDMASRFSPVSSAAWLMARDGGMPMRSSPSNSMLDSDKANDVSPAAQNSSRQNTGLLSRFDLSIPQRSRSDSMNPDDLQESDAASIPAGMAQTVYDDKTNLLPEPSLRFKLPEAYRADDADKLPLQRVVNRSYGIPAMRPEELENGVSFPTRIDDLLGNFSDIRVAPRTHTVLRGENPSMLGERYFHDPRAGLSILAENGLPTSVEGARSLKVGRVLTVPDNITNARLRAGGQFIADDTSARQQAIELAQRQRAEQSNAQASFGNGVAQPSKSELVSSFNGIKEGIKDIGRRLKEKHGDDIFSKGFDQNSIYITTYADINKKNPELGWTGLAPFASNEVRAALAWLAKWSLRNRGEPVEGKYFLSATPDRGLDSSSMPGMAFNSLANGNQAVFEDLTPYLRFYQQHGAAKLLSIAENIGMHKDLQTAFKTLQASQESKDPERAEILRAISAKQMLRHEQRNVLQKMYDEPITSGGAWLNGASGSRILPLDVHVGKRDQPGYFEISPTDKSIDLSNFDDRWAYASKGLDQFTARYNNPATRDITRQQIHQMADPRNLYQIPPELVPYMKR
ncbi:DUF2515 family protein [Undibacterium sp. JH2W]